MNRQNLLLLSLSLAVLTGAALFYLNSSPSIPSGIDSSPIASSASSPATAPASASRAAAASPGGGSDTATPAGDQHPSQTERGSGEKYSAAPKQPWEKDLIALSARLDLSDEAKVRMLLAKISSLPPDGKVLAMEFATKLIPDEQYLLHRPTLFGLVSSPELRETVLLDALTRGDTVRMPTLVEMMRQPTTTSHEDVREILLAYIDTDHGSDLNAWDSAVKKFLAENPDL